MTNLEFLRYHIHENGGKDPFDLFKDILNKVLNEQSVYKSLCLPRSIETDYLLAVLKGHPYESTILELWHSHRSDLDMLLPVVNMVLSSCYLKNTENFKRQVSFWLGIQLKDELDPFNVLPQATKDNGVVFFDRLRQSFYKTLSLEYDSDSFMGGVALKRAFTAQIGLGEVTVTLTHNLHTNQEERAARLAGNFEEIVDNYIQSMEILERIRPNSDLHALVAGHIHAYSISNIEFFYDMLEETAAENPRIFPEIDDEFYETQEAEGYSNRAIVNNWHRQLMEKILEDGERFEAYTQIILDHWSTNAANAATPQDFQDWWGAFVTETRGTEDWDTVETEARTFLNYDDPEDYYEEDEVVLFEKNYSLSFKFTFCKHLRYRYFEI